MHARICSLHTLQKDDVKVISWLVNHKSYPGSAIVPNTIIHSSSKYWQKIITSVNFHLQLLILHRNMALEIFYLFFLPPILSYDIIKPYKNLVTIAPRQDCNITNSFVVQNSGKFNTYRFQDHTGC